MSDVRPGRLKVYLGAAPGVGKTYRMLDEGRRRAARGADVVIGFAECHGRPHTEAMLDGLETVARAACSYRGGQFEEMDLAAVLQRRPQVAIVDEFAHSNIPGAGRNPKRWQDIETLLDSGIDVITALNIQHLESLNDVVEKITGVPQHETVPDEVVRRAWQIELVDMPPEGLRRRMAHGNIYAPEKIDAALANYFRPGNLTALRQLALLWTADRVDEALQEYRTRHGIGRVWETRERVVVALTGGPEGDTLVRRAARIADRSAGGDLLAVHVARSDGLAAGGVSHAFLARQRRLVEDLGGSYHSVVGDDVATALVEFARAENATQLVLGTSRRGRLARFLTGPGTGETVTELSGDIDVHRVTHERSGPDTLNTLHAVSLSTRDDRRCSAVSPHSSSPSDAACRAPSARRCHSRGSRSRTSGSISTRPPSASRSSSRWETPSRTRTEINRSVRTRCSRPSRRDASQFGPAETRAGHSTANSRAQSASHSAVRHRAARPVAQSSRISRTRGTAAQRTALHHSRAQFRSFAVSPDVSGRAIPLTVPTCGYGPPFVDTALTRTRVKVASRRTGWARRSRKDRSAANGNGQNLGAPAQ
ncbi:universal stress protein [Streptomyces sp. FXJ1.172]|nr:universal stress protein [Streptomyces sp. FXJ1.172]WEP00266.1 universal stress protein [Streptomyces sp. FXJ1.172]